MTKATRPPKRRTIGWEKTFLSFLSDTRSWNGLSTWLFCGKSFIRCWELNPNLSLDRYGAEPYGEDNFLSSFIFLLASCFSFVLDVAHYAFKLSKNYLLNNQIKSVQDLITDWGLKIGLISSLYIHPKLSRYP